MELFQDIVVVVVTFGVLVIFHEFGHFWVARRLGVKVLRFAVGFGRPLWRRRGRDGVEYAVCALPLGGYVKMVDEREGEVAPEDLPYAFNRKPVATRFAVVAAGPLANFVLALLAYWVVYATGVTGVAPIIGQIEPGSPAQAAGLKAGGEIIAVDGDSTRTWRDVSRDLLPWLGDTGKIHLSVRYSKTGPITQADLAVRKWLADKDEPDLLGGLGVVPWTPPATRVIDRVLDGSPAAIAGLKPGDEIISAGGETMPDWSAWVHYVQARPAQHFEVTVKRKGHDVTLGITPKRVVGDDGKVIGRVGVAPQSEPLPQSMIRTIHYGPLQALGVASREVGSLTAFTFQSIGKLLTGLISPKNLSGPITIAKVASASAQSGLESWLSVVALLSVSLGVLNLLPIPVLDGGHLMFYAIEWIKGSPVSEKVQTIGYQLGFSVIIGIMLLALYNDISRL